MERLRQDCPPQTTARLRRQRALALLAAPAFALALMAAANPADESLHSRPDHAGTQAATQRTSISTARLDISGTVHDAPSSSAEPVQVRVYAWPPDFAQSPDGFSLILLGETQARADGTFSVRPDYSRLWAEIASSRSQSRGPVAEIDIEIVAESASGIASYTTTAQMTPSSRTMRFALTTAVEQNNPAPLAAEEAVAALDEEAVTAAATRLDTSGLDVEMQLAEVVTDGVDDGSTDAVPDGDGTDVVLDSPNAAPGYLGGCYLSRDLGSRLTQVGALGATTTGYTGRLRYTSGATTSTTAGVSTTGAYGTFSASGTTSRTSTASVSFPTYNNAGYRIMRTQFNYAVYRCPIGTHTNAFRYVTRMTSFDGGSIPWAGPLPTANYCVRQSARSGFTVDTSTARTLTAAVSGVHSAIGMNMSAQTGYNRSVSAEFSFTSGRALCGTNGMPGNSPGTLIVKP